jgi:hypothetical protein
MQLSSRRSLLVAALLCFAGASGCAAPMGIRVAYPIPPDRSILYIYRPARLLGGATPVRLMIDGQKSVMVLSEKCRSVLLDPGRHSVAPALKHGQDDSLSIVVSAGQEYFVQLETSLWGPRLRDVSQAVGRAELLSCRPVEE